MKSSHHEQIRRRDAKPNQSSPTAGFGQLAKIDQHTERLGELFENPQNELRQFAWDKAPAREESFEKFDHERRFFPEPRQKSDAEKNCGEQSDPRETYPVERDSERDGWLEPDQVDCKQERHRREVINALDDDRDQRSARSH